MIGVIGVGHAWTALLVGVALLVVAPTARDAQRVHRLAATGRLTMTDRPSSTPLRRAYRGPLTWACAACAGGALFAFGLLGAALDALLATGALLARDAARGRADARGRRDLTEAIGAIAAELEAGAPVAAALSAGAELDPAHGDILRAAAFDHSYDALLAASEPTMVALGHAWRIGATTGGRLADVLTAVVSDVAAADERSRTVASALAGPRASCALLACLPALGYALGLAMGAHPGAFLFDTAAGRGVCFLGVALDVVGVLWVRTIVRRAAGS